MSEIMFACPNCGDEVSDDNPEYPCDLCGEDCCESCFDEHYFACEEAEAD